MSPLDHESPGNVKQKICRANSARKTMCLKIKHALTPQIWHGEEGGDDDDDNGDDADEDNGGNDDDDERSNEDNDDGGCDNDNDYIMMEMTMTKCGNWLQTTGDFLQSCPNLLALKKLTRAKDTLSTKN
ncbi:hypothetical protein PoB_002682700 [Plakobranchus ocellatus]|uniref:Uncharacterized protein n=1 Tax=Plakobranchus ocellatus TaxID=259542 RepID=A0AAV3ZZ55_9GAST|nr:hypothetical protein PoB_002682700 [Plakobranchus ocellatus]